MWPYPVAQTDKGPVEKQLCQQLDRARREQKAVEHSLAMLLELISGL